MALAVPFLAIASVALASTDQSPPSIDGPANPFAQEWAAQLAREGRMRHASQGERAGAGENLWMGSAGYFGPDVMIGAFADEQRHYLHGTFPQVSRTGQWSDVGHYTQMVWRDTKEVGCAIARGARDDFLVCRYWPAGNWYGRKPY